MGTLHLVRHAQASFGSDDYDRLSPLGHQQARQLGAYWQARGQTFEAAITGTLRRHRETLQGIAEGLQWQPTPLELPGLNEYDGDAVIATVHPEPLPPAITPEDYRHHFRLLREGLARWMDGSAQPAGMPSYPDFVAGIVAALDHVRTQYSGHVLMVSSGGPISTVVGQVLGTPPATTIELNLRIRNSAVSEFAFTPKRHMLVTYNTLPHLDAAEFRDWLTYA
ncbi:histidine phosphatase family protein [Xylophilus sp. GW821-FHT01B05]